MYGYNCKSQLHKIYKRAANSYNTNLRYLSHNNIVSPVSKKVSYNKRIVRVIGYHTIKDQPKLSNIIHNKN
jgi:hypothetical protein